VNILAAQLSRQLLRVDWQLAQKDVRVDICLKKQEHDKHHPGAPPVDPCRFPWINDRFPWINDRFPWIDDRFPWIDDRFPWINDRFPWINDRFPWINDRHNLMPEGRCS
jgi:hypothetical protein